MACFWNQKSVEGVLGTEQHMHTLVSNGKLMMYHVVQPVVLCICCCSNEKLVVNFSTSLTLSCMLELG